MTKKERRKHEAEWETALTEGRVVRYPTMNKLRSYPTRDMAERAAVMARENEVEAEIVRYEKEEAS